MAYKVKVDDSELRALLGKVSKSVRNLEQPLTGWGRLLVEQTKQQFEDEKDPDGVPWVQLSPTTLKRKARLGQPLKILTATGAMRESFRFKVKAMQLDLISDSPYLKYHQRGTSKMPQRKVLGITPERKNQGAKLIRSYLKGKVKR